MTDTDTSTGTDDAPPPFRIGMLGPSGVGKTSLVVSVLTDSERLLGSSGVRLREADKETRNVLRASRSALNGGVLAESFESRLAGGSEARYLQLELRAGRDGEAIGFSLLDFPGGWMAEPDHMTEPEHQQWKECLDFLTDCNVLLVPVDATVLMEAVQTAHLQSVTHVLETMVVQDIVLDWAQRRADLTDQPALIVFAPVKCESYFADNGGRKNRAVRLLERVRTVYGPLIELIRLNAPHAKVLYCPVDTLGCVELVRTEWHPTRAGSAVLAPVSHFGIRRPTRISIVGADDLLSAVCRMLMQSRSSYTAQVADRHDGAREQAEENLKSYRRGWFRALRHWANGDTRVARLAAAGHQAEAERLRLQIARLDDAVRSLATRELGKRSRWL
ncbi:hypothetical protein AB0D49_14145 [Streptomyces sp. NPDC048290]|uniref:hypothetical protein n=1 Tax=Streptomyces sp. NPDC048290 TaxID=3155811 RepID=UPI003446813F